MDPLLSRLYRPKASKLAQPYQRIEGRWPACTAACASTTLVLEQLHLQLDWRCKIEG